jgi:hypothetical protein
MIRSESKERKCQKNDVDKRNDVMQGLSSCGGRAENVG